MSFLPVSFNLVFGQIFVFACCFVLCCFLKGRGELVVVIRLFPWLVNEVRYEEYNYSEGHSVCSSYTKGEDVGCLPTGRGC